MNKIIPKHTGFVHVMELKIASNRMQECVCVKMASRKRIVHCALSEPVQRGYECLQSHGRTSGFSTGPPSVRNYISLVDALPTRVEQFNGFVPLGSRVLRIC